MLDRFLSSRSGWRTAFQIGHATPSSDTEPQRRTSLRTAAGPGALSCCTLPVLAPLPGAPLILPHATLSTRTSSMHRSKRAEHPRTGTPDGCRGPLSDGTNSLPRSPVAGISQVPAQPGSPAANFLGGGCLKSSCRLCLAGAEPARAAGKVTQEETAVQGGRSPSRNPFGAAALQGCGGPRHLRALTRPSRPVPEHCPGSGWSHPCQRREKLHKRQRCRP